MPTLEPTGSSRGGRSGVTMRAARGNPTSDVLGGCVPDLDFASSNLNPEPLLRKQRCVTRPLKRSQQLHTSSESRSSPKPATGWPARRSSGFSTARPFHVIPGRSRFLSSQALTRTGRGPAGPWTLLGVDSDGQFDGGGPTARSIQRLDSDHEPRDPVDILAASGSLVSEETTTTYSRSLNSRTFCVIWAVHTADSGAGVLRPPASPRRPARSGIDRARWSREGQLPIPASYVVANRRTGRAVCSELSP